MTTLFLMMLVLTLKFCMFLACTGISPNKKDNHGNEDNNHDGKDAKEDQDKRYKVGDNVEINS